MNPDVELYSIEELMLINHIENGEYTVLPREAFESEKERFQDMAKKTLRLQKVEKMIGFMRGLETSKETEALTMEDINRIVHDLR